MEVRKWTTVDVHYKKDEQELANKEHEKLKRLGYECQAEDDSGAKDELGLEYDFCNQYIKSGKTRIIDN